MGALPTPDPRDFHTHASAQRVKAAVAFHIRKKLPRQTPAHDALNVSRARVSFLHSEADLLGEASGDCLQRYRPLHATARQRSAPCTLDAIRRTGLSLPL
jgi:hypothetical protein